MIFGITCVSCGDKLLLGVITDKYCLEDPDEFMQILNSKFKQFQQEGIRAMQENKESIINNAKM